MKKKTKDGFKLTFIVIFSFVMGGVLTLGILKFTPIMDYLVDKDSNVNIVKDETKIFEKGSLAPAVEKVYDATVLVKVESKQGESTGSAFVYKVDNEYGYLLTNQHVVTGAENATIVMSNDKEVEAKVLGGDEYLDLAVLRIDKDEVIQVANIGKSETVNMGDSVFAVGSPMGYDFRGSVTSGIISGKDRMVSVSVSSSRNDWVMRVLQVDASINPGNSGGPLLNSNGEVIGICSMKLVDSKIEGMGFAIPIEYAMNHIDSLENDEKIKWPVLGIEMVNVTDTSTLYKEGVMIDQSLKDGVVVVNAVKNGAAAEGGLQRGDVITKLNNKEVKDVAFLRYELYQYQAGDRIDIEFNRNGKTKKAQVTLK